MTDLELGGDPAEEEAGKNSESKPSRKARIPETAYLR
jgi:hypothetical protein